MKDLLSRIEDFYITRSDLARRAVTWSREFRNDPAGNIIGLGILTVAHSLQCCYSIKDSIKDYAAEQRLAEGDYDGR